MMAVNARSVKDPEWQRVLFLNQTKLAWYEKINFNHYYFIVHTNVS
jgi:hypothetical protein